MYIIQVQEAQVQIESLHQWEGRGRLFFVLKPYVSMHLICFGQQQLRVSENLLLLLICDNGSGVSPLYMYGTKGNAQQIK